MGKKKKTFSQNCIVKKDNLDLLDRRKTHKINFTFLFLSIRRVNIKIAMNVKTQKLFTNKYFLCAQTQYIYSKICDKKK